MPIKGLTDTIARFPCIGKLRKGSAKAGNRPGQDLDHFRFDSKDRDAIALFSEQYGDRPRQIEVMLPYDGVNECFFTCKEEWSAGGLKHRCDGEICAALLVKGRIQRHFASPVPCPGGCKEVGRLSVVIPVLKRFAYVSCETHSKNDIVNLHSQLLAVQQEFGSLRRVPFILTRRPEAISTPGKGKRIRREKWMLSIEINPEWARTQFVLMQHHHQTGQLAGINNIEVIDEPIETVKTLPPTRVIAFRDTELWQSWRSQLQNCQDQSDLDKLEAIARQHVNTGALSPSNAVHNAIDTEVDIVAERIRFAAEEYRKLLIRKLFAIAKGTPFEGKDALKKGLQVESISALTPDQLEVQIKRLETWKQQQFAPMPTRSS